MADLIIWLQICLRLFLESFSTSPLCFSAPARALELSLELAMRDPLRLPHAERDEKLHVSVRL